MKKRTQAKGTRSKALADRKGILWLRARKAADSIFNKKRRQHGSALAYSRWLVGWLRRCKARQPRHRRGGGEGKVIDWIKDHIDSICLAASAVVIGAMVGSLIFGSSDNSGCELHMRLGNPSTQKAEGASK